MKKSRYLVTGGTGAIGPRIVKALQESGSHVRVLSLRPPPPGLFPEGVEILSGDITSRETVNFAARGIDGIVHLAALLHIENPAPALWKKFESVNIGGTSNVMEAARREGARRVVFFSTIAVYGEAGGRVVTEDTPPQPLSFYAKTKLTAERIVLSSVGSDGRPLGAVLRLGSIYGSRVKGNYQRLLLALACNRFIPIGNGLNRRTIIYDKDAAAAALLALDHPEAAGNVYNVSDGRFHTLGEIIETICTALSRKPPHFSLPLFPVRLSVEFLERVASFLGKRAPIRREAIDKYTEDLAVDSGRMQRELGFSPRYDLLAGWQETVQEMRKAGQLDWGPKGVTCGPRWRPVPNLKIPD